ncbi:charged multivesicular body protein 5 [Eremomyces bilateralis CBS 781.70]|uniref:Charged multivesicular body protein 5 n=1 Tax=Eremomyces bilateralis CBS 781.70 TaxID=1392243 RepID=A0A6G1G6W4_9PEZI|nr:charged multivesicular body protein 5 [Eremomyces bilateralis CBS 781.70]KAF1813569.1 charged multivesicular body protein 5 [Eremomyces bilateralis CBS 781.70]
MNRLFGATSAAPKPSLNDAVKNIEDKAGGVDIKLAKLNSELSAVNDRLKRMREGPGKQTVKKKALGLLKQRRQYEGQLDQLRQQVNNMEQAGMMQDNLKNTMVTVDAMKTTTRELKKQYGKVNIDQIERLQDEMADLMDIGNDIQESMSRSYDVPEDIDEEDLEAELEALGDEMEHEATLGGAEGVPSYLMEDTAAPPQFIDEPPETSKVKETAG